MDSVGPILATSLMTGPKRPLGRGTASTAAVSGSLMTEAISQQARRREEENSPKSDS